MIIVGVDGSDAGFEAVAWAAREAELYGVPLRVAHVLPKWAHEMPETGRYADVGKWMRSGAADMVAAGVERARREAPGVKTESVLLPGDPREALIEAAGEADLLVVGGHGMGGFRSLLVGSVAYGVAGHVDKVVVVRQVPAQPRGRVVVGVDGSPAAEPALEFAFAEASRRSAELHAVHAWRWVSAGGGFDTVWPSADADADGEARVLAEALAGRRERYPDVKVVEDVVKGHTAEALTDASAQADLLVVGSRGRGTLTGLVLGSVSHALLSHAQCPIAVIRQAPTEA
jgi:nucleotide-binding universal stress UspA family protein